MIENYLGILEESLRKKIAILDEIGAYNNAQEKLLKQEKVSLEDLDANMNQKDELIRKVTGLDEGFEALYERIRDQLAANKDAYKKQIRIIQELISQVTDRSVAIQAQESRNKKLIEQFFSKERIQLGQNRQASKAAYDYYKSMSRATTMSSQIMDQKQ